MKNIIIITGPPGSGKSTIAGRLAERVKKGSAINVDDLRHMIKAGYVGPWENSKEARKQRKLATKNACDLAAKMIKSGFDVFIDDVMDNKHLFEEYKKLLGNKLKFFLLLPSKETIIKRLFDRKEDSNFIKRAEELQSNFSKIKGKLEWQVIDNSHLSIEETASKILPL